MNKNIKINFTQDTQSDIHVVNRSFYKWFKNNLIVKGFPKIDTIESYDVILNVSDEYSYKIHQYCLQNNKLYFWFPMSECNSNMGLHSIYGAMNVLKHCEQNKQKVLLHCHVGANRSPTIKECYFVMKTRKEFNKKNTKRILNNIEFGHLPAYYEFYHFLLQIDKNESLDTCINRTLNHK